MVYVFLDSYKKKEKQVGQILIPVDVLLEKLEEELIPTYQREGKTMHEAIAQQHLEEYKELLSKNHNYIIFNDQTLKSLL